MTFHSITLLRSIASSINFNWTKKDFESNYNQEEKWKENSFGRPSSLPMILDTEKLMNLMNIFMGRCAHSSIMKTLLYIITQIELIPCPLAYFPIG